MAATVWAYDRGMDPDEARALLTRERQRIESAIAALHQDITANAGDEDERDIGAGAARMQDEEIDLGLLEQLGSERDAIARAEQRLAAGTYGLSVESGEPIPDQRLALIPWAERTVEEQAKLDGSR